MVKGKFFVVSTAIIAVFPVKCVNFVVDLPKRAVVCARDREHQMTCFDIKTDNNVVSNGNAQVNLSTYYIYRVNGRNELDSFIIRCFVQIFSDQANETLVDILKSWYFMCWLLFFLPVLAQYSNVLGM